MGRYFFIMLTFLSLLTFIDLNASNAFYTFISKKKQSPKFVSIYLLWTLSQVLILFFFLNFLIPDHLLAKLWIGESKSIILLGMLASFMQGRFWSVGSQMAEASRNTLKLQYISVFFSLVHFVIVLGLWLYGKATLHYLFIAIILEWLIAGVIACRLYSCDKLCEYESIPSILVKYKIYCFPLILLSILNFTHSFSEKWMLQNWGGSSEQGYYGVAMRISSITLLVTNSIFNIFWKEITVLYDQKNFVSLIKNIEKTIKYLFVFSSLLVAFIYPYTDLLIYYALGPEYLQGSLTFKVLLFYPITQALTHITSSFFFATEDTKTYSIIGSLFVSLSIVVNYFALAPSNFFIPGLNLGSFGLSLSLLLLNIILFNYSLYYIFKKLNSAYNWKFQFLIFFFLVCFFLLKFLISFLSLSEEFSFLIYCLIAFIILLAFAFRNIKMIRTFIF